MAIAEQTPGRSLDRSDTHPIQPADAGHVCIDRGKDPVEHACWQGAELKRYYNEGRRFDGRGGSDNDRGGGERWECDPSVTEMDLLIVRPLSSAHSHADLETISKREFVTPAVPEQGAGELDDGQVVG